jgi:small GTP-binding protein
MADGGDGGGEDE